MSFLLHSVKTISNIHCHVSLRQNIFLLVPLHFHLPLPFVGGSVDVDELFVALISDDGVLNLFSSSGQDLLLQLLSSLLPEYDPIQPALPHSAPVVWNSPPDEDQGWEWEEESCESGEYEEDTGHETQDNIALWRVRNGERQDENRGEENEVDINKNPGQQQIRAENTVSID